MTVSFRAEVQGLLRERLLDAAYEMIETSGWSSVTMAKLAAAVGVSRQTVHTEVGTRHKLAEALALARAGALPRPRPSAAGRRDRPRSAGIRSTCRGVLELAQSSVLVRTVFGSSPARTTPTSSRSSPPSPARSSRPRWPWSPSCVRELYAPLPFTDAELDVAAEAIVRLVLSAITRPSKPPAEAAADIAWVIELALAGAKARQGTS